MKDMEKSITLIGLPGCGKTTVGNLLSDKLNYKFIDISSTKIRSDIYKYRKYLDDRVFKYIIDNKLYGGSYE